MRIFPTAIVRIAGLSQERWQTTDAMESTQLAEKVLDAEEEGHRLRQELIDALHAYIGQQDDSSAKKALLKLKRQIAATRHTVNTACLDGDPEARHLQQLLVALQQRESDSQQLFDAGEAIFVREFEHVLSAIRGLAEDRDFQSGLLLSSRNLLNQARHYITHRGKRKKRERQTERSLVKYLSRMARKTTPFGSFTYLSHVALSLQTDGEVVDAPTSYVRLNNYLFRYLQGLLVRYPPFIHHVGIRLNPTFVQGDEHYRFLINDNNIESFQTVDRIDVVDYFLTILDELEDATLANLVQRIVDDNEIDASAEELFVYCRQLVDVGVLEFAIPISGVDPEWDLALSNYIQAMPDDQYLGVLCTTLRSLREAATEYEQADVDTREILLVEAHAKFKDICRQLYDRVEVADDEKPPFDETMLAETQKDQSAQENTETTDGTEQPFRRRADLFFRFAPHQMFLEDCAWSIPEVSSEGVRELSEIAANLAQACMIFDGQIQERRRMAIYFAQQYGQDAKVSFVQFYEDYYRDIRHIQQQIRAKEEADEEHDLEVPALESDAIKTLQDARDQWMDALREQLGDISAQQIVHVQTELLNNLVSDQELHLLPTSNAAFIQCFRDEEAGEDQAVLTAIVPGFGRYFGRFLHLFPPSVTDALLETNQAMAADDIWAENTDASFFNANLHPPLSPFEVCAPSGHNRLSREQQIDVTRLMVRYEAEIEELQLVDAETGKQVQVLDLGFQTPTTRSQLFQLLDHFSPCAFPNHSPIVHVVDQAVIAGQDLQPDILRYPRIVIDKRMVLRRARWVVQKSVLPLRDKTDSDWGYFLRLWRWVKTNDLPTEFFVRIAQREETKKGVEGLGQDDYKPQYISLRQPLTVALLGNLLPRVASTLEIEEVLPATGQGATIEGETHTTEHIVQWTME